MGSIVAVFPLEVSTMKTLLYLSSLVWTSLATNFSATLQVNEYGVLYNQTQVYDPTTGDMIIHVPSHWRNGTFLHDLTKVENENLDITVWKLKDHNVCFLEKFDPEEHSISFMLEVAYMEAHNVTIDASQYRIIKFLVVDDGEWKGDREELTENMQSLCSGVTIRKAHHVQIDETMVHRRKRQASSSMATRRASCCWCGMRHCLFLQDGRDDMLLA